MSVQYARNLRIKTATETDGDEMTDLSTTNTAQLHVTSPIQHDTMYDSSSQRELHHSEQKNLKANTI